MFGYACDETDVLMPCPITYAHLLVKKQADINDIFIETIALSRSRCPFITNIIDFMVNKSNVYYFSMELAPGGELFKFIKKGIFNRPDIDKFSLVQTITKQLLIAISTIHQQNIIHSDLKPENIVCMYKGNDFLEIPYIKLADFGLAFLYSKPGSYHGSPLYMAPEILGGKMGKYFPYNISVNEQIDMLKKSDVWSIGCIVYELLVGSTIFEKGKYMSDSKEILYVNASNLIRDLYQNDEFIIDQINK